MYVEKEYNNIASQYDHKWSGYLTSTQKAAIKLLNPINTDNILDASGGTGLLAEKIAKTGASVTLVDLSEEMIALARNRLREYSNTKVLKQDVHALPFQNKTFSKIISSNAFHFYTNPNKVLKEFYRVLKSDGELVIIDWCRDDLSFKAYNLYKKLSDKAHIQIYTVNELEKMLIAERFKTINYIKWNYKSWSLMGLKMRSIE